MLDAYDKARLDGFTGSRQELEKRDYLMRGVDITKSYSLNDTEQKMTTNQPSTTAAKALIDMIRGEQGPSGPQGERGEPGLDLYQLAVLSGFKGSFYQFMSSLKGENGDSITGPKGEKGEKGPKGDKGERGADGRDGDIPNHQIESGKVRFELPGGAWGAWVSIASPAQTSQMGAGPLSIQKFYSGTTNFPDTGQSQILYFDTSASPHSLYVWDGTQYQAVGGSGSSTSNVDSWIYYAANWSSYPVSQGTIAAGEVFAYELNGNTRYRLVPSPYDPEDDAFYSTFTAGVLGTLLVSRTWADSVGGVSDHGLLTGLTDDDHPQYHNNARGDLRYQPLSAVLTNTTASFTTADETKLDALAVMVGATALTNGVTGTVPAALAGDEAKVLRGDGTWVAPAIVITDHGALTGLSDDDHPQYHNDARGDLRYQPLSTVLTNTTASFTTADETKLDALAVMVGATSVANGVTGTVPAALAGDQDKFLKADSTWAAVSSVDTVQTAAATGATLVASWGSVVVIPTLTGNITITYPTPVGNIGKTIKVVQNGVPNAFTITHISLVGTVTFTNNASELAVAGGAVTIEAISNTSSLQVASATIFGAVAIGEFSSINLAQQFTNNTTFEDVAGSSLSLTAGTWELIYTISTDHTTGDNTLPHLAITDSANVVVPGSIRSRPGANTALIVLSAALQVTVSATTTYKLRFQRGGGGSLTILSSTTGNSTFTAKKISGYLPVSGTTVEYITASTNASVTTNVAAGDHAKFDTVLTTGGVTLDTATAYSATANVASIGRFTLKAGKTYKLAGHLGDIAYTSSATNYVSFRWFNSDANTGLGGQVTVNSDYGGGGYDGSGGTADAIFTPSVDTRVELRIVAQGAMTSYGGGLASSKAYAEIIQIGSTATTGNAFNSLVGATAANTLDNTALGQSWNWSTATTGNPLALSAPALTTGSLLSLTPAANAIGLNNNGRSVIQVGTTTNTTPDLATGAINDFLERKIKNTSAGTAAQTGYTAESDTGQATSGFAWMGINNSSFANPQLYNAGVAGDVTFVGSGQSLILANASQTQPIRFQTGKAASPFFDDRMVILNSGLVGVGTATPLTNLDVIGSSSRSYTTTALAAYTVLISDSVINLSLVGAQTVTMPAAASFTRRIITVRNPTTTSKLFAAAYTTLLGATTTAIPAGSSLTLQSTGSVWQLIDETSRDLSVQRFVASGTYTPTPGMKSCIVEMSGGGAGGRPSIAAGAGLVSIGPPGGNGGYCRVLLTRAQVGTSVAVTIGAGGADSVAGGATAFGALISCSGGGIGAVATSGVVRLDVGGAGGNPTVTTGEIIVSRTGNRSLSQAFVIGITHVGIRPGTPSPLGAGALPQTSSGTTAVASIGDTASGNSGCGGNGGYSAIGGAAAAGGSGADGYCVVTEYF